MKREEKNTLSRKRILEAAMEEFSQKGYDAASLNMICGENNISKGIIYHYFQDKDELYLCCAAACFEGLADSLSASATAMAGNPEARLRQYFDARLHFFAGHPVFLGIFLSAVLYPPAHLTGALAEIRKEFDHLNEAILTALLKSAPMRADVNIAEVVDDFRMYMDYFNARFRTTLADAPSPEQALTDHEERCHRQLKILLYGVLER